MIESDYLKDNVQNLQTLLKIYPLRSFETKNLQQLLRLSKIKEYEHGEQIIKENENDPWIFFLLSGKVRVERKDVEIGIIDREGEIFGEMRLLNGLARSASVHAEGKTVCLGVDTSAASTRLTSDERADILLLLYRIFTEFLTIRLRLVNEKLVETKRELEKVKKEK